MAGTDFLSLFSSASLTAFKPDSWGILGHKPTMSDVAKIELQGIFFKFSILLMKSFESLQLLLCNLISTVYRIHKLFQKNFLCRFLFIKHDEICNFTKTICQRVLVNEIWIVERKVLFQSSILYRCYSACFFPLQMKSIFVSVTLWNNWPNVQSFIQVCIVIKCIEFLLKIWNFFLICIISSVIMNLFLMCFIYLLIMTLGFSQPFSWKEC